MRILPVLLVFGLAASFACGESPDGSATVSAGLTATSAPAARPGPARITEVNVVIREVLAHRTRDAGAERLETDHWETVVDPPVTANLLKIGSGDTLGSSVLTAGYYDRVRLIFGAGDTIRVDGKLEPLLSPVDSTFEFGRDLRLTDGKGYRMLFQIDLAKSIQESGGEYSFVPVLTLTSFEPEP